MHHVTSLNDTASQSIGRFFSRSIRLPHRIILAALAASLAVVSPAFAADNGLGQKPLMGWSSWQAFKSGINASTTQNIANAMVAQLPGQPAGVTLKSVGYVYVNVDSGWRIDNVVDSHGYEVPDTSSGKFPNGIKPLADFCHNLGLKFGLYLHPGLIIAAYNANAPIINSTAHTKDIADTSIAGNTSTGKSQAYKIIYSRNGAVAYIQGYANLLASWDIDYMKFDFVGPGGGNVSADNRDDMQQWLTAFENTGRPMWVELSNSLKLANVSTWKVVSNGARIDGDVESGGGPAWSNISSRFSDAPGWASSEGATANGGFWGDMDSLPIGDGGPSGLSSDEKKTAMTLWSICCSPLIIGRDITKITSGDAALLANTEVIAVDQAGHVATPGTSSGVWRANNGDGTYTVALFNTGSSSATKTVSFSSDLGFSGSATVRDLLSHTDLGTFSGSFSSGSLATHACRLVKVTPSGVQQQVAAPTFSPVAGSYTSTQSVTISTMTGGASIRYTTDGSTPTSSSGTIYSGPVSISVTTTLKAIAYESGFIDSTVTSGTYTIGLPQASAPVFSPGGGTFSGPISITTSTSTPGATIRYTTDGSTPTETHGNLGTPIGISVTTTLKAIAYAPGFADSAVTTEVYIINSGGSPISLEAESLSPVGTGATVSISNDANASGGVVEFLNSTAANQSMTLTTPSIAAGTYQVQLRYKTNTSRGQHNVVIDGTQVGGTVDQYATTSAYVTATLGNVVLSGSGTHTIVLNVTGKNASATQFYVTADVFTLTPQSGGPSQAADPVFTPGGGSYTTAQSVTITSSTGGASIRYTTDGSTPSETAGTLYSGPVSISVTSTLKAIAYESGFTDSNVISAAYTIGSTGGTTVSFEAESLTYTPNGATASVQTDTNSSGGKWIQLAGNSVGDFIDYAIPSVTAGTYQVQMEWKGNNSRGILQLSVDGANVGPTLDQYSSGQTYPTTTFGTVTFSSAGTHTVRLTVTGKNSASSAENLSADKFTFVAQ